MLITHLGHAAFLLEEGDTRLLLDPGTFSEGLADTAGITAILATHAHADHLDQPVVAEILRRNPSAMLYLEHSSLPDIESIDEARVIPVHPAQEFTVGGINIAAIGGEHEDIYPDIPRSGNVGYFFPQQGFYHPGDSFTAPRSAVRVLALPVSGPWQGLADAVDYLRIIGPSIAIPMHESLLADPPLYFDYIKQLTPKGTDVQVLEVGSPITV